jgi:hypothetical protein
MKIYSLSKVLILPAVLLAFGIYFYAENMGSRDDTIWLFIPVFLLVVLYIFNPQIDYWWHRKYPLPLDPHIKNWLSRHSEFYRGLDKPSKKLYEERLGLYIEAREFKSVGSELREVPEDIKGILASIPVQLTLHDPDFLLGEYDRIYIYHHPFPSPKMPFLHTVEVDHEDGVILFSLEQFLPGILDPKAHFPVGLYGFMEAYFHLQQLLLPENITPEGIERFSYYSWSQIEKTTGRKNILPHIVLACLYVIEPEKVRRFYPKCHEYLDSIFLHLKHGSLIRP